MPTISGEGYLSNKVNAAGTYYAFLVIDGQKVRRSTGTKDLDDATDFLTKWKAQVEVGVVGGDQRVRYEDIRNNYLESKHVVPSVIRELDQFFKSVYISAITPDKIKKFRTFRETQPQVVEYQEEIFQREFELRKMRAQNGTSKKLTDAQLKQIEADARKWVSNGVKATTNRRLTILRAMFNKAAEDQFRGMTRGDVPASFCLWEDVDNVKTNKFTDKQFQQLLNELPENLHAILGFYYATGMRTGQIKSLTYDMVHGTNLTVPGLFTKNGQPHTLPLADKDGQPFEWSARILRVKKNAPDSTEQIFDTTNFIKEWRKACHKLKLGIYNEETGTYRGASPHDFRRTAVTNMINKGIAESVVMQISAHKTNSMMKRYGIVDQGQMQAAFTVMQS